MERRVEVNRCGAKGAQSFHDHGGGVMLRKETEKASGLNQQRHSFDWGCRGGQAAVHGKVELVAMNRMAVVDSLVILEHVAANLCVWHREQRMTERAVNLRAFFVQRVIIKRFALLINRDNPCH